MAEFPSAELDPTLRGQSMQPLPVDRQWWSLFEDEALSALIEQAVSQSYDLRVAEARVQAAEAVLTVVETRRRPTLDLDATLDGSRASSARNGFGADRRLPEGIGGQASLGLNWEIDLFGRIRRQIEAARADAEVAAAVRADVSRLVVAAVATTYIEFRGLQERLRVAERNVALQGETLSLVELLVREGGGTALDSARARQQFRASAATIPAFRAAVAATLNRLTTLVAEAPGALSVLLDDGGALPQPVAFRPTVAPLDLLRRRPDIEVTERSLAAATARIGIATADLYPTVSFQAAAGVGALFVDDLASTGAPFFSVGPRLRWSVFDRTAIRSRIQQAGADTAERLATFEATVTTALEEVDSALARHTEELQRQALLAEATAASGEAAELARLRYRAGVEDFLAVLDAERQLLQNADLEAGSRAAVAQAVVDIYRAVGGGWENEANETVSPEQPAADPASRQMEALGPNHDTKLETSR